ncbi:MULTISPECIES: hypothetical protein [unclassified Kitasatospora]|uniref:hypothetical protein n=1 Tax=unclassified Kitasatospora TaxID=2633591 RepID=UPI0037FE5F92
MYPLGLGVVSWWWIAVLATAVFLAVLVPGMPTRTYRIQTALAPLAMAAFAYASYAVKHMEPTTILVMYVTGILVFPLGAIGHRRKLAQRLMEAQRKGESDEDTWPPAMMAQMLLAAAVLCGVYLWIAPW